MGHKEDHTGEGEAGWAIRRIWPLDDPPWMKLKSARKYTSAHASTVKPSSHKTHPAPTINPYLTRCYSAGHLLARPGG